MVEHRLFLAETAVSGHFEERKIVVAGIVDEGTATDRLARALDKLFHQVEQLERFPNPLKFPNVRDDSGRPVMRG
jgi:hypothetical protein